MSSFENRTVQSGDNYVDLMTEMHCVIEREVALALIGICDDFKQFGLPFNAHFRTHFSQLIQQRVTKTYDQFMMNLKYGECRVYSVEQQQVTQRPYLTQKRKKPDDVNNQMFLTKKLKVDEGLANEIANERRSPKKLIHNTSNFPTKLSTEEVACAKLTNKPTNSQPKLSLAMHPVPTEVKDS
ncbi:uncharacterized protein LOC116351490, partial [Contarinia nasturtii]|uniref:uncharacterized protein LOC116351490 n=1 Tax=Contarinia nasturtii TaxID=265458 RepID=UPI0012D42225